MRFKDFFRLMNESISIQDILKNPNQRFVYVVTFSFFGEEENTSPIGRLEIINDDSIGYSWPQDDTEEGDEYAKTFHDTNTAFRALHDFIRENKQHALKWYKQVEIDSGKSDGVNYQLKYNTDYYMRTITDLLSFAVDLPIPRTWKIVGSHPDHDTYYFGVEISKPSLLQYLIKHDLEEDEDLNQLL